MTLTHPIGSQIRFQSDLAHRRRTQRRASRAYFLYRAGQAVGTVLLFICLGLLYAAWLAR